MAAVGVFCDDWKLRELAQKRHWMIQHGLLGVGLDQAKQVRKRDFVRCRDQQFDQGRGVKGVSGVVVGCNGGLAGAGGEGDQATRWGLDLIQTLAVLSGSGAQRCSAGIDDCHRHALGALGQAADHIVDKGQAALDQGVGPNPRAQMG